MKTSFLLLSKLVFSIRMSFISVVIFGAVSVSCCVLSISSDSVVETFRRAR